MLNKKIKRIHYNWFQGEGCEDYFAHEAGKGIKGKLVTEINIVNIPGVPYHAVVNFEDGSAEEIHNINTVFYKGENKNV